MFKKIFLPGFSILTVLRRIPVEWLEKATGRKSYLDVDNTLLPRDEVQLDADVLNWLELLRKK